MPPLMALAEGLEDTAQRHTAELHSSGDSAREQHEARRRRYRDGVGDADQTRAVLEPTAAKHNNPSKSKTNL